MRSSGKSPPREPGASFYEVTPRAAISSRPDDIAAAFGRFERKLSRASGWHRLALSRVGSACALFTLAAFIGGLSLARFSFNSAESSLPVASHTEELIYLPPAVASAPVVDLPSSATGDSQALVPHSRVEPVSEGSTTSEEAVAAVASDEPSQRIGRAATTLSLDELNHTWGEAMRFAVTGYWQSAAHSADPLESGYQSVEVSVIPEASTGIVVAVLAAIVVVTGWWRRRASRA